MAFASEQKRIGRDENTLERMLKVSPPESAILLKRQLFFPNDTVENDDHIFWEPYDLAADNLGNLFVADRSDAIFKFSSEGIFLNKFGRTGQGPGDLSMPLGIRVLNDTIAVKESGNWRVQRFDLSGRPLGSTRVFKTYCSFDVDSQGRIFGVPLLFAATEHTPLVEVLTAEGQTERAFGRLLDFPHDYQQLNMANLFLAGSKEVIVVFDYFPIIRRYTEAGELAAEYNMSSDLYDMKSRYNRNLYSKRPDERVAYIQVVHGAAMSRGRLYLTDFVPPRLWIYEVDLYGKIINTYWAIVGDHYSPAAIVPHFDDNTVAFYILTKTPEPRVEMFVPENR